MRIGELARRTGVGVSTLRAWERRYGFLAPERSTSGQRRYTDSDLARVEDVLRLVSEGLTLPAAIARVTSVGGGAPSVGEGESLLFAQIVQAAGEGIWVSRHGRTRFANRRMAELLGCSVEEMLARSPFDFLPAEDAAAAEERYRLTRAGQRLHFTQWLVRVDGTSFLAEMDTAPLIDHRGGYDGSVAMVTDITARAETERQLRIRSALLDAVGDAVAAADADERIVYVNPAAERYLGRRAADLIGTEGPLLMAAPDAFDDADLVELKHLADQRFSGTLKLVRADRSEFVAHLTSRPAFDADGSLLGHLAVIKDETEQLRLAKERRALEAYVETLAVLGEHAFAGDRRNAGHGAVVVNEALEAARRLLGADGAALFDVVPGADELPVRAATPLPRGPSSVPGGSRSFPGYVALSGRPQIAADVSGDPRFETRCIWADFRPAWAVGAPVSGDGGVRGVLVAVCATPSEVPPLADQFVHCLANVVGKALA